MTEITSATWAELLEVARFTPSPHNTQPWKLRPLDDRRAELLIDPRRTLPDEDTTGCFILCAMGMFVESLAIAAGNSGMRLDSAREDGEAPGGLIRFARLTLEPDRNAGRGFSNEMIVRRRTSRLAPEARAVPGDVFAALEGVAGAGGQRLVRIADAGLVGAILERNVDAVFHDLNDARYHDEIVTWFRYGEAHAARTSDGLDSRCMNTPAHELWMAARFPGLLRAAATRRIMRALYHRRLGPAHELGMLAGEFFERDAAERAGRCLMRLWLTMHGAGVSIHPFGNLVTNEPAHRWLTGATGVEGVWLVFRMGYTGVPPRSRRLAARELMC